MCTHALPVNQKAGHKTIRRRIYDKKSTKTFRTDGLFTFSTLISLTNSRHSEYFRRFVEATITMQTESVREAADTTTATIIQYI